MVVAEMFPEPSGGAHSTSDEAARLLKDALRRNLDDSVGLSVEGRLQKRYEKFRRMGDVGIREDGVNPSEA